VSDNVEVEGLIIHGFAYRYESVQAAKATHARLVGTDPTAELAGTPRNYSSGRKGTIVYVADVSVTPLQESFDWRGGIPVELTEDELLMLTQLYVDGRPEIAARVQESGGVIVDMDGSASAQLQEFITEPIDPDEMFREINE
jgi:hypothetical protein